jgi:hypothetical protein
LPITDCHNTIIHAAEGGHDEVVQLLLATGKVDVFCEDWEGWTPRQVTEQRVHRSTIELLERYEKKTVERIVEVPEANAVLT